VHDSLLVAAKRGAFDVAEVQNSSDCVPQEGSFLFGEAHDLHGLRGLAQHVCIDHAVDDFVSLLKIAERVRIAIDEELLYKDTFTARSANVNVIHRQGKRTLKVSASTEQLVEDVVVALLCGLGDHARLFE
jgi:hypothetical protein